ncbi:MAG: GHKL domain-containing protein [Alteromonadaceae bacterium]|nr:GHKL domain-containing protein [Alteromonadaceae bacterium]
MSNTLSHFLFWQKNSLKTRLVISALLMIIIVLPIIGITLNNAFSEQIRHSIKNELSAYSYAILAVAEVDNKQLFMPEQLLDNQLNVSQTGLYALLVDSKKQQILWRSKSLLGLNDPTNLPRPKLGETKFSDINLAGKAHLIYSFSVSFGAGKSALPMTLHIIKDKTQLAHVIGDFKQQLWTWLILLMVLLVLVQLVWLKWTLKPLRVLQQELADVEKGERAQLQQDYPQELQQVTNQLNLLLTTEQNQRQRYRNALADLAHSLKTPLAVMQSQQDLSASSQEQLQLINQMIEHQLKRAQSAGQAAWHLGIKIAPIAKKLVNTLAKIYQDKQLTINCIVDENISFKGDEADLMEILGNLLDNACKAAKTQVVLNAHIIDEKLEISIADDGNGIALNKRKDILQRGMRADSYQQGHGIGLAIVRDLVDSYQGELLIEQDVQLAGALFVIKLPFIR